MEVETSNQMESQAGVGVVQHTSRRGRRETYLETAQKRSSLIDSHWIWGGALTSNNGRGVPATHQKRNGRNALVSLRRVLYEELHPQDDIQGFYVQARCGVDRCVNPEHLRLVNNTLAQGSKRQLRNNKSGYKGVSFYQGRQKWGAHIAKDGKKYFLGYYGHLQDAVAAVDKKREELYGPYVMHRSRATVEER